MLLCNTAFRRLCSKLRNLQSTLVHISNQHINTSNSQQMSPQQTHNELMASKSTTYLPPTSRSPRTREGKALPPPHSSARDDEARRGGEKQQPQKPRKGRRTNQPAQNHKYTTRGTKATHRTENKKGEAPWQPRC